MIDSVGVYTTRSGRRVEICEIDDPAKATFNCKGHWIKPDSLGRKRRHFEIWQPNGRFVANGLHSLDVIAKETP
jgi:hypothetical protein